MDKFDAQIRKGVQRYLKENIKLSSEEVASIHMKTQKRKVNFKYITAFSLVSLMALILIIPIFQDNVFHEYSTSPFSNKNSIDKIIPVEDEDNEDGNEQGTIEEDDELDPVEEEIVDTDSEREAIFLELLDRYNKEVSGFQFDYDYDDEVQLNNAIGFRVIGFDSKKEIFAQFTNFITEETLAKMFCLLGEDEVGPYILISTHCRGYFETDKYFQLEKISDDNYRITQTIISFWDGYTMTFEFTKVDGKWLITDWERIVDNFNRERHPVFAELEPFFQEFNQMNKRIELESDQLESLNNGLEGYKVVGMSSKEEFYRLFLDLMTIEVAELIWSEFLVEHDSSLYMLPKPESGYYPYESIEDGHYNRTYYLGENNNHQVTQHVPEFMGDFIHNFVVQQVDGQWLITEWSLSYE